MENKWHALSPALAGAAFLLSLTSVGLSLHTSRLVKESLQQLKRAAPVQAAAINESRAIPLPGQAAPEPSPLPELKDSPADIPEEEVKAALPLPGYSVLYHDKQQ